MMHPDRKVGRIDKVDEEKLFTLVEKSRTRGHHLIIMTVSEPRAAFGEMEYAPSLSLVCLFNTYVMGRTAKLFDDPLTFDPERFNLNAPKASFLPWPGVCTDNVNYVLSINSAIKQHLLSNNLLSDAQFGF
eukprot:g22790.t1